jgi:acetoin utilization deacetylase AcuC-like enzyme
VHANEYVDGFLTGTLDAGMMRRIGFPWSPELVKRTLASAGGTLGATCSALETGFGGTLAGGTHHAFRERGSGFCVFNDLAIAIAWAREKARVERAAVVDLDVHQGDGTAAIFSEDPGVFTVSLHGAKNFPFRKQTSSLDIELPDGTSDEAYLTALEPALQRVWEFSPQLVIYQAGVDGLESDRLGRLSLTLDGLRQRDALVIGEAQRRGIPLVVTLGGGYSDPLEATLRASAQTFLTAAAIYCADSALRVPFQPRSAPEPYVNRRSIT